MPIIDFYFLQIDMFSSSNSINDWPVYVKLSNGHLYGCDFIVSATGVIPNTDIIENNKQVIMTMTMIFFI